MNVANIYGPEDTLKFINNYGVMSTCKGWVGNSIEELYNNSTHQSPETIRCVDISNLGYYLINLKANNSLNWKPIIYKYCLLARV